MPKNNLRFQLWGQTTEILINPTAIAYAKEHQSGVVEIGFVGSVVPVLIEASLDDLAENQTFMLTGNKERVNA